MQQLKDSYPRLQVSSDLKRAKSQENSLDSPANLKTQRYKTSIQELQQKISRFTKANKSNQEITSFRINSPDTKHLISSQGFDKPQQSSHVDMKKKVLKETVSTTTT